MLISICVKIRCIKINKGNKASKQEYIPIKLLFINFLISKTFTIVILADYYEGVLLVFA